MRRGISSVETRRTTEVIVGIDPSGKAALLPSEQR